MTKITGIILSFLLITTSISLIIPANQIIDDNEKNFSNYFNKIKQTEVEDILDQNNSEIISGSILVDSATTWKYAQSFIPSLSTLSRVEILMYKSGNGGWRNYTVAIRETVEGINLTSITYNPKAFEYEESWVEFDFPDINVIPGKTYYILCIPSRCLWSNRYYLRLYYGLPDPYSKGEGWMNDEFWEKFEIEETPGDFCFKTYGYNLPPNQPNKPVGTINGVAGEEYNYTTFTIDPDNHKLWYWFDWGDGTNSGWIGPYNSGITCKTSHNWEVEGSYSIVVKAKDEYGEESSWSDPLSISMPKSNMINIHLIVFLEKFQYIKQIFTQFLKF